MKIFVITKKMLIIAAAVIFVVAAAVIIALSFSDGAVSPTSASVRNGAASVFRRAYGERGSGKQGKCIDTCNFHVAEMLVGVPPNPLDFWTP